MAVLVIHLDKEETEKRKEDLRGLELAIRLYKEYEAEQPVVITSPKGEAVRFQGSAFFSLVFKSPLTGGMMILYYFGSCRSLFSGEKGLQEVDG